MKEKKYNLAFNQTIKNQDQRVHQIFLRPSSRKKITRDKQP